MEKRRKEWGGRWDEEKREIFKKELEELRVEGGEVQEMWEEGQKSIKRAVEEMEREEVGKGGEERMMG